MNANGAAGEEIHRGVSAVRLAGAFNHRPVYAVMDAANLFQVIRMTVSLENGQYLAGLFQNFAHLGRIFHAVVVGHVQALVDEDDRLAAGRLQVSL